MPFYRLLIIYFKRLLEKYIFKVYSKVKRKTGKMCLHSFMNTRANFVNTLRVLINREKAKNMNGF